jgi:hypothetical protein
VINNSNTFLIKSLYEALSDTLRSPSALSAGIQRGLKVIWVRLALEKVQIFFWQLIFIKLPTRGNLGRN